MSRDERFSKKEIDRLAERLRADDVSDEDAELIREAIRCHPEARRRLVEHLYLSSLLKEELQTELERVGGESTGMPARILGLAAVLALACGLIVMVTRAPEKEPSPLAEGNVSVIAEQVEKDSTGIAVLAHEKDAVWSEACDQILTDEPLVPGIVCLEKGFARIDFYSGATLLLEGPARLELISPTQARYVGGKIGCQLPVVARGFELHADGFTATRKQDSHFETAEFFLMRTNETQVELHGYLGHVAVKRKGEVDHVLEQEQSLTISGEGEFSDTNAGVDELFGSLFLRSGSELQLQTWREYSNVLKKDKDVLVYYDFESPGDWVTRLPNQAEHAAANSYGVIVGCRWGNGRWPGKSALEFSNSSDRIRINVPGEYGELTLACWVRIDSKQHGQIALINPETSQDSYVHWSLRKGRETEDLFIQLEQTSDPGRTYSLSRREHYYTEAAVVTDRNLGSWMHMATTYSVDRGLVSFYVNGKLIEVSKMQKRRKTMIGITDIGNWPQREWARNTEWEYRHLDGAIDEFLILNRVLSANEIRTMWLRGAP